MKKTLPSLVVAMFAVLSAQGIAQERSTDSSPTPRPSSLAPREATNPVASAEGQSLARRAIIAIDSQRSVYLQLRQKINMFDQQLVGNGVYQQLGEPEQRRLRLDLKVKVAHQMTSMQQVCNGRFLYIRRDFGQTSNLGRVDLRRIREAVEEAGATEGDLNVSQQWMLLGGLPRLLARLEKNFQFTAPQDAVVENTPVTVVDGFWKPEALLVLAPQHKDDIAAAKPIDARALSRQLPTQIRLIVRRDDSFPLRIEYLRAGKSLAPDQPPPIRSIMSMELYDIRLGEPIDPLRFVYQPGNQEVADHTEVYLGSLGLKETRQADRNGGTQPPKR